MLIELLDIEGFRGFERLTIPRLGQVNLIVGQNGVGKTTLLEALRLLAVAPNIGPDLRHILASHGDLVLTDAGREVLDFARVFAGDKQDFAIHRNRQGRQSLVVRRAPANPAKLTMIWAGADLPVDGLDSEPSATMALHRDGAFRCVDLPVQGLSRAAAAVLWQATVLTEAEGRVSAALRILDPTIERIAQAGDARPLVKRRAKAPEPLSRLGGGFHRMLEIGLALVQATRGVLLIDEIETGLHFGVLPELWKIIFTTAAELDVQVFATTHSWDCIEAFQQAASAHPAEGLLIHIDRTEQGTQAALFDEAELQSATRQSIDAR